MDSSDGNGGGSGLVVSELSHIKELVTQLEVHLGGSPDLCKHLAAQISSLTERSIVLITSSSTALKRPPADAGLASPLSATPTSDVSDGPFKSPKKRKVVAKQRQQVRVSSSAGETPVDDGHSWRKYGQKEILGAKHPRGYYRCTHRHSQGCSATKQVQRTDEDPKLFDVIYHGAHTCVDKAVAAAGHAGPPADSHADDPRSLLQSLSANLTVKTEGLPAAADPQGWGAFCFSSTPASGASLAPERSPFSAAPSTSGNWGVSPATSDSNHAAGSFRPFEAPRDAEWREQSLHQEVVSALVAASTPPAPLMDADFDEFLDFDAAFDVSCLFA